MQHQGAERLVIAMKSPIKRWSEGAVFKEAGALCQPETGGANEPATIEAVLYSRARRAGSMETGEGESGRCGRR